MEESEQHMLQRLAMLEAAVNGLMALHPEHCAALISGLHALRDSCVKAGMSPPRTSLLHLMLAEQDDAAQTRQ